MIYRWADGAHFSGPIEPVMEAVKAVQGSAAEPDAAALVEAARNPKNPLHAHIFRVSDRAAALEYRKEIARSLVRSIVSVKVENGVETVHRAFYFVRPLQAAEDEEQEARVIVTREQVLATPVWRRQVVSRLRQAMVAAQRDLQDFGATPLTRALPKVVRLAEKELAEVQ